MAQTYFVPPTCLSCNDCGVGGLHHREDFWANLFLHESGTVAVNGRLIGSELHCVHECDYCHSVKLVEAWKSPKKLENFFPFKFSCIVTDTQLVIEVE